MLDSRNKFVATALGVEPTETACVLGQLVFDEEIKYDNADPAARTMFDTHRKVFHPDAATVPFDGSGNRTTAGSLSGHRVGCSLNTYCTELDWTNVIYGWVVKENSIVNTPKSSVDLLEHRDVLDGTGVWPDDQLGVFLARRPEACRLPSRRSKPYYPS